MHSQEGRFHLCSDTSKFATGSALYQIQIGKPRLIAYSSNRLPETIRSYSITKLELCGLAINIATFSHLLKRVDIDAIVDHLALTHKIKSKVEPATPRIKKAVRINKFVFIQFILHKGERYDFEQFLLRQTYDDSDPYDIIPISFDMHKTLCENYYKIETKERYLVQM